MNAHPLLWSAAAALVVASVTTAATHDETSASASIQALQDDGTIRLENKVQVEVDGDEVRLFVNGEPVDVSALKEHEGIFEFQLDDYTGTLGAFATDDGTLGRFRYLADVEFEAPPVMLGVHMDSPTAPLASHLGIDAEATTLITSVSDGLPAAKAGVREHDVITRINGEAPADPARLRKMLHELEPGATLRLTGFSEGKAKEFSVVVEKYDAKRLGAETLNRWNVGPHMLRGFELEDDGDIAGQAIVMPSEMEDLRFFDAGQGVGAFAHAQSTERNAAINERLERLDKRLADLERLLERLADE